MAKRIWWCAIGLLLLAGRASPAATVMNVSEVRAGMLAVGKSVFHGTTIESFRLRILGVEKKMNAGRDVILAQVLDGPVVAQRTGIISGMSGSPVYVNGRLIGAIAFGCSFSRVPIAGITPIGDMLTAWQPGYTAAGPPPPARIKVNVPGRGNGELRPGG